MVRNPREIEAATKALHEKKKPTAVKYKLEATVEHSGITGSIQGSTIYMMLPGTTIAVKIQEDEVDDVVNFLKFSRNECEVMREQYSTLSSN